MKKMIVLLSIVLSSTVYAQQPKNTELDILLTPEIKTSLSSELLKKKKPEFKAHGVALLDERGDEINLLTAEMIEDFQQHGATVPVLRIGRFKFMMVAPQDPRQLPPPVH